LVPIDTDRGRVFESGGQTGAKIKAVLTCGYRRGSLSPSGNYLKEILCAKWGILEPHFGPKLDCFDYKQTAILIQTFGHKWFSEAE